MPGVFESGVVANTYDVGHVFGGNGGGGIANFAVVGSDANASHKSSGVTQRTAPVNTAFARR